MFKRNILLSKYSNFKIGGPAKYFFEAKNVEEIIGAIKEARRLKERVFILGGGTNILFSDKGFNGLVIRIQSSPRQNFKFGAGRAKIKVIKVNAGVSLGRLVGESADAGLSGLEWAAGIPGTIGGAIRGNAGAFGGEMRDIIVEVSSLDISGARFKIIKRKKSDCGFNYRSSIFKCIKTKEIITEAVLRFKKGEKNKIKEIVKRNLDYRRKNHPMEYPSIGSIFKNVPLSKNLRKLKFPVNRGKVPAAYLISEAGLKGISRGGAMISPKHPNFIVNISNATANDVKNLIKLIKKEVFKKFKIKLEEEIVFI